MIEFETGELNARVQIGQRAGEESNQLGLDDESAPVAHVRAQHVVAAQIYTIARRDREDVEYVLPDRAARVYIKLRFNMKHKLNYGK